MQFAKTGSGLYVLWGLLHVAAAYDEFILGAGQSGLVQGKLYQGAWNLLFFALAAIVIAVKYNWYNSRLGYWLNLIIISVADIGFVIFVFIPGHVTLFPAILGPVLWLSGGIFTTLGIRAKATD
jgi:hypothetical protein